MNQDIPGVAILAPGFFMDEQEIEAEE